MHSIHARAWLVLCVSTSLPVAPFLRAEPPAATPAVFEATTQDPALQILLTRLTETSSRLGAVQEPAEVVAVHLRQADLLHQIAMKSAPEGRAPWLRQMADSLNVAALSSPANDTIAFKRLVALREFITQNVPDQSLAAYVTLQEIQAEFAVKLGAPNSNVEKVQSEWLERQALFVRFYPEAVETPKVVMDLAVFNETAGKAADARGWYQHLATAYPTHALSLKARGALNRHATEGKELKLALPLLFTADEKRETIFDLDQLRGHVVVVAFWAKGEKTTNDLATLRSIHERQRTQGVELVCINLDNGPEEARAALKGQAAAGVQVYHRGGPESRLANRYGLIQLPHVMLVGKDGTLLRNRVELGDLEAEIEKRVK